MPIQTEDPTPKRSAPDTIVRLIFGFNLSALLVMLICGLALALLEVGLDALGWGVTPQARDLSMGPVLFVAGALAERRGYRPRVLFFPIWFAGLVVFVALSFEHWGWLGLVPLVVVVLGSLVYLGFRTEAEEWQQAPISLEELKVALLADDQASAWARLDEALFVPGVADLDAAKCRHDREVLRLLREHLGSRLWPAALEAVERLDDALAAVERGDATGVEPEVFKAVKEVMAACGEDHRGGSAPES